MSDTAEFECPLCGAIVEAALPLGEMAYCSSCHSDIHVPRDLDVDKREPEGDPQPHDALLVSTTPGLEGITVTEYLGPVSAHAVMGANILRDIAGEITDVVGGRAHFYESLLDRAVSSVLDELRYRAWRLGADGVVGLSYDYETVGVRSSMLLVAGSGTAVKLESADS